MDAADNGRSRGMSWIKVENSTPNKPEVLKLARLLGVSRDDAFGKAMRFWIWLDGVTVDGVVDGVTSTDVDAVVGTPGVADALIAAGWLSVSEDGQSIVVPNFDRHNGESAKARGLKTKRQAKWRSGRVDGVASTTAPTREEKNIILSPVPQSLNTEEFKAAWLDWLRHIQHVKGQAPSEQTQVTVLMDLVRMGAEKAIRDIRFSIKRSAVNILDGSPKADKPSSSGRQETQKDPTMPGNFDEFRKAYGCKEQP
jgi:DNA replication protein DnaT